MNKKIVQCGLLFNNLLSFSCVCAVFVLPRLFSRVFASSLQILFSIFRILLRKIFEIQSEFLSVVLYDYELKFILQFIIYPEIRTDVFNFFARICFQNFANVSNFASDSCVADTIFLILPKFCIRLFFKMCP